MRSLQLPRLLRREKQVTHIKVEDIEKWLDDGGVDGKNWTAITKENYASEVKAFYNWLKKRKHVDENPVLAMEQMLDIDFEPEILTLEQCEQLLRTTMEIDPKLIGLLVLMLFCGIRPSEAMRLKKNQVQIDKKRVILSGKQTKTRQRRIVDMTDNAIKWWNMGAQFPVVDANHRWNAVRQAQKAKWGIDKWPHDCLRHSYASYHFAEFNDAGLTAKNLGHPDSTLLRKDYNGAVTKAQAKEFWAIRPSDCR